MNPISFDQTALKNAQLKTQNLNDITDERTQQATHIMVKEVLPIFTMYFADFSAKYGKSSPETINAAMREYGLQLIKNNITPSMLKNGLERVRKESVKMIWTPNPQAFAELCMPQADDLGLPSIEEAISEVTQARGKYKGQPYNFTHHIIETLNRQAGRQIYELKQSDWHKLMSNTYDLLIKQAMRGELKEPVAALPHRPDPKRAAIENEIYQSGEKILQEQKGDPLMARIRALKGGES
jgi:hypothetical protein